MLVEGITRANYDTIGAKRLATAESQLNNAIKAGASDETLLKLQKTVDDLKNSISVREQARQKYLNKLIETERRVRESQFNDIKQKFDESNQRNEAAAEKSRDAIRTVSEKINGTLGPVLDKSFHALLGPLNLVVNPLEQAFKFNIFKIAKKPVADFLEGKFPSTYQKLKNDGGLIGAVGVAIIDAIHGKSGAAGLEGERGEVKLSGLLGNIDAGSFATILKGAGIVALVAAAIAGIISAWKGEWDKNGIEESKELKDLLKDESVSTWAKVKAVGKYIIHSIFGVITGGLRGAWESLKGTWTEMTEIWSDPGSSVFSKIWDTIKTALIGLKEVALSAIGGVLSSLGDRIFGFFDENAQEWWENFKEKISGTFTYIFDTIKNFFSWENIQTQWEELKADPKQWISDAWDGIKTFFNNVFSKIGQAFTGDDEFDFGTWIKEKINNAVDAIKNFFTDIFDKVKNAITGWWDDTKLNPANWFGGKQTTNVVDANGNLVLDANGNPITEESTWTDRVGDYLSTASWLPWNWGKGKKTAVEDAIISKDNDLYIPSDDDNILVTKSNVVPQSTATSTEFQQELLSVVRRIADSLKQPTVVNNVNATPAIDFGGFRL